MAPDSDALTRQPLAREAEIDRMRGQAAELRGLIGTDVLEVRRRVRSTFDLGRQIANHPLVAAAAVVVGVLAVGWVARLVRRAPGLRRERPRREGRR